ncbi:MAG TPA: dual specificity protein phosphatase family protein [Caulobacteraceae bacterium]|nr:dual specificity protein phosphatase family protein [Caulobacteraceae bacterium]
MERWTPNFHWITDQLAVGGSFPRGVEHLLADKHRIGAVVDLREEACDDAGALEAAGIDFLHLPTVDLKPSTVAMLDDGVEFVRAKLAEGRRVLIHCEHGIGRSAILSLCVLAAGGWDPMHALGRAKDRRALVSPSPEQYEGWVAWLTRWKARRGADWDLPPYEDFCAVAYRHLASA